MKVSAKKMSVFFSWCVMESPADEFSTSQEICSIPKWPLDGFGRPGGPGGETAKIVPKCVSRTVYMTQI